MICGFVEKYASKNIVQTSATNNVINLRDKASKSFSRIKIYCRNFKPAGFRHLISQQGPHCELLLTWVCWGLSKMVGTFEVPSLKF